MIRMPLASASLLAIAIALAGCGEKDDKAAAPQAQAPAAAASTTAAAPGAVDEAAGKAVVKHYAENGLRRVQRLAEAPPRPCRPQSTRSWPSPTTKP